MSGAKRQSKDVPSEGEQGSDRPRLGIAGRRVLGDVVADRLRDAILDDMLLPGQHLREEELSEQLAVSRGPVRDAFVVLEREGLIVLSRHRGATVVTLTPDDLGEVYSLRHAIEGLAVRMVVRRGEPEDLAVMEESLAGLRRGLTRRLSEQEAARLDLEFHDGIFLAAHHERLYKSWSAIRMQVYWFLCRRNIANSDWRHSIVNGHQAIVDLIVAGDEVGAEAEAQLHVRAAYSRILEAERPNSSASGDASLGGTDSFLM